MTKASSGEGPTLRAALSDAIDGLPVRLLTPRQRQVLLSLSTRLTAAPRATICHEQALATAVFICSEGAAKSFRELPSGKRRVTAFLFPDDLFGLAERGRYLNSVQALTRTVYYRIPLEPLKAVLRSDAELQFHFLAKVVHELRAQQLRSIIMGRRSARGRVAMFLTMLEKNLAGHAKWSAIPLPMSRTDIAGYLGLSLEAVSRSGKQLVDEGIIAFGSGRTVRVLDRKRLERLAADV